MHRCPNRILVVYVLAILVANAGAQTASEPPASAPQSEPNNSADSSLKARVVAQSELAKCVNKAPDYPTEARRMGLQGRTMVLFTVSAEGKPEEPRLMRSSGHLVLDRAAVRHIDRCIKQYTVTASEPLPAGRYALPMDWRLE
jgi:protein TonB